ncbi:hypothetical protein AZ54_00105 [Xanthomonas oryzae pv. oryzae PXO86]|nr:hypothetical protein [Xanthomonas oryzae]AJQ85332.1 hypothetical protein AZ54_00105 [Xanthomonas oryzae pv. oryzae PXO86]AZK81755.1 hypothetical protein BO992_00100 [Xanthomonas oryzae pv. oryzae]
MAGMARVDVDLIALRWPRAGRGAALLAVSARVFNGRSKMAVLMRTAPSAAASAGGDVCLGCVIRLACGCNHAWICGMAGVPAGSSRTMHISMWSAHAALPTNRPAAIAATMTVCFQTIIVVLHAVNAWLRLAARSAVSGLTADLLGLDPDAVRQVQSDAGAHRRQSSD